MRKQYDYDRIYNLTDKGNYGVFAPCMDAQTALNELANYFLGDDWYSINPVNQLQINTEIVCAIEQKYKGVKVRRSRKVRPS